MPKETTIDVRGTFTDRLGRAKARDVKRQAKKYGVSEETIKKSKEKEKEK